MKKNRRLLLVVIGLSFLLGTNISCSKKSTNSTTGSGNQTTSVGLPEVPGKGSLASGNVNLQITSVNTIADTIIDTLSPVELAQVRWDMVVDTLIYPAVPPDTQFIVWIFNQQALCDTTIVLDSVRGYFYLPGLPPDDYNLIMNITGPCRNFFFQVDTSITHPGGSFIFLPVYDRVPFGTLDGHVYAAADSTPLFNTINLKMDIRNLDNKNSFNTDSTGYYYLPYLPLTTITISIQAVDTIGNLYQKIDTTVTIADTARRTIDFYLPSI